MGITSSKQRADGLADGKFQTPSPPMAVRMPTRKLARDGKTSDARTVAVGVAVPAKASTRRKSDSDMHASQPRGLARWQVSSLPDAALVPTVPTVPSMKAGGTSPPTTPTNLRISLKWLESEESPISVLEFKHGLQAARANEPRGDKPVRPADPLIQQAAALNRNIERLTLLQQAAVRVDTPADAKSATQAVQWLHDRVKQAGSADIDAAALHQLAQDLVLHRGVLAPDHFQAIGHALGELVRVDSLVVSIDRRYGPLARLLAPVCALQVPALSAEQLGALLAGVRSAFPAADRLADQYFQRAIDAALREGVPLGQCVAMACGLYHGSNDRPGRAFSTVRLDLQAWPSPHERLVAVLNWGRRLVLDAPSVYAQDAGVPADRRFEWMMTALTVPGVARNQQASLTQGRHLQVALEALTPAQREALAAVTSFVEPVSPRARVDAKSGEAAVAVSKQSR